MNTKKFKDKCLYINLSILCFWFKKWIRFNRIFKVNKQKETTVCFCAPKTMLLILLVAYHWRTIEWFVYFCSLSQWQCHWLWTRNLNLHHHTSDHLYHKKHNCLFFICNYFVYNLLNRWLQWKCNYPFRLFSHRKRT